MHPVRVVPSVETHRSAMDTVHPLNNPAILAEITKMRFAASLRPEKQEKSREISRGAAGRARKTGSVVSGSVLSGSISLDVVNGTGKRARARTHTHTLTCVRCPVGNCTCKSGRGFFFLFFSSARRRRWRRRRRQQRSHPEANLDRNL